MYLIRFLFMYSAPIWFPNTSVSLIQKLQTIQNSALRIATDCVKMTSMDHMHEEIKMLSVQDHLSLISSEIMKLVMLCFDDTLFSFNNKLYRKISGTPMCSPVSVIIAEIVMQEIEKLVMPLIKKCTLFWYRYVIKVC